MNPFRSKMTPHTVISARGHTISQAFKRVVEGPGSFLNHFIHKVLRKWVTLSTTPADKGLRGGLIVRWCDLAQLGCIWHRGAHLHKQRPWSVAATEGAVSQLKAKAVLESFLFPG